MTLQESVTDHMPDNVSINKVQSVGHGYMVSLPVRFVKSMGNPTYVKLTKNQSNQVVIERLSI
jgi:hypothetical protein